MDAIISGMKINPFRNVSSLKGPNTSPFSVSYWSGPQGFGTGTGVERSLVLLGKKCHVLLLVRGEKSGISPQLWLSPTTTNSKIDERP